MKESSSAYVPRDRLIAIANQVALPSRANGSVLFADISGFTPLTESFEKHLGSRHGAEELTRVLNDVYASLIEAVEGMRGSVLGFAGDAITCWFNEDDGARAVYCALAMQTGMQKFQSIPSPGGGTVPLGLKAAVTTGEVKRFVVGDRNIQLVDVLAGDPVYRVAEVEQACNKGEVRIDKATYDNLKDRISASLDESDQESPETYIVQSLKTCPDVRPWPDLEQTNVPSSVVDPWMIASIRDRLSSGLGEFLTELRPATAMFLKFSGIDFETDDDADQKLNQFFSQVQTTVDRYEGVVHQLTVGDKGSFLYAAFGAPVSHEDDTLRALATALELQKLMNTLPFIDSIQIGITSGSTRTGAYGGPTRRTYGVLGDQVNLAARFMGKAKPGQILVSDSVAAEGCQSFRLKALQPVQVKGKAVPVKVHSVEGTIEVSSRARYSIPMVGRVEELNNILNYLNLAQKRHGQAVTLVADPGLGKTRLVDECIQKSTTLGFQLLYGECQSFGSNSMYTPWWSVWREFFGLKGNETAEQAEVAIKQRLKEIDHKLVPRWPVLGPVLNMSLPDNELTRTFDAKLRRASMEGLLIDCLRFSAAETPVLIVLEDVHAIDPLSKELLESLIQGIARQSVMILIAMRPGTDAVDINRQNPPLEYLHCVRLEEFSPSQSSELIHLKVHQLFGADAVIPGKIAERIIERTGGNPFFIEEIMNWIHQEKADLDSLDALDDGNLPVSLYSLVLTRMDQLDENSRVTMKVASVIGRMFRAAVIWGVYPELGEKSEIVTALNNLSSKDFTTRVEDEPELAYLFKHVVMHEVAYESLPMQLRARLHEAIGIFIENHFPAETPNAYDLLAFHFGRSQNEKKKLEYYILAGDASRKAYANTAASKHYRAALPLLGEEEKIPVLQNLGKVLEFSGDWEEAMDVYRQALDLSTQFEKDLESAFCRLWIGDMLRKKGEFEKAREWLKQARTCFESIGDEEGIGQALHSEGTLSAQSGNYDRAKDLYTRSMEIRRRLGDQSKVASLLSNIGIIVRFQGDVNQALLLQQESLRIRRELNDPWAIGNSLNNLGMAKRYKGDFSGARKNLEEALGLLVKVGDRAEIANTLNSLAELALDQKDLISSDSYLQESLRLSRELGNLRAIAFLLEAFAANALYQNNPSRSLRLFGAAKALRESIGAPLPDADSERMAKTIKQASDALSEGDPKAVLQEGTSLPLTTALDFAEGVKDSEF